MTIETRVPISRRGLLAAVVGGTAAALAGVASRAERAFAAGSDGETVVVGGNYPDVRTATTLAREVDIGDPIFRLGTSNAADTNTTELGPSGVVVQFQGSFTGRSTSRLRPGILTLTANDRSEPDTRTDITSESVTSPSVRAVARDRCRDPRRWLARGDVRRRPGADQAQAGHAGDASADRSSWRSLRGRQWSALVLPGRQRLGTAGVETDRPRRRRDGFQGGSPVAPSCPDVLDSRPARSNVARLAWSTRLLERAVRQSYRSGNSQE